MLDIKLSIDKSLQKVKCDNPDIPIINSDNAVLFLESITDYTIRFNLPKIKSGLTIHKNEYFFFEHNIIETPKSYYRSVHSYNIYQITKDLADSMISSRSSYTWEIRFNSLYNFGKLFISIRRGSYIETYQYSSRLSNGELFIPNNISPSRLKEGISIGNFLKNNIKEYPKCKEELILNKNVLRDIHLENLFE